MLQTKNSEKTTINILYLRIARCVIKLVFYSSEYLFFQNQLISDIKKNYNSFLSSSNLLDTDFTIYFKDVSSVLVFVQNIKRQKGYFVRYAKSINKRKVEMPYGISLKQFQMTLSECLEKILANKQGFSLHSSGVRTKKGALLFTGNPEAGKSTCVDLLKKRFQPIADDSTIIQKVDKKFLVFQTPYIEKNNTEKNASFSSSVHAIFFLKKDNHCKIEKITNKHYIIRNMLSQVSFLKPALTSQFKTVTSFIKQTNFYLLTFAKDEQNMLELFTNFVK